MAILLAIGSAMWGANLVSTCLQPGDQRKTVEKRENRFERFLLQETVSSQEGSRSDVTTLLFALLASLDLDHA